MNVLIVEDNLLNQKIVSLYLSKQNHTVFKATNGKDALAIAKNNKLDLILMDIMLPGMNGFEITVEIRKFEKENGVAKNVPIIALTANTLDSDKEKCLTVGMNDYLPKPFTADELIRKVNKFIV